MSLDLTNLSREAGAAFLKDGARFSSEDTLEQTIQALNASVILGAKLAEYGFGADDAQELQNARDALSAIYKKRAKKRRNGCAYRGITGGQAPTYHIDVSPPQIKR